MEQLLPPGRGLPHPGVVAAGELLERQKSQDLPQVSMSTLQIHRGSASHAGTASAPSHRMSGLSIIHHTEARRDSQHRMIPPIVAAVAILKSLISGGGESPPGMKIQVSP